MAHPDFRQEAGCSEKKERYRTKGPGTFVDGEKI